MTQFVYLAKKINLCAQLRKKKKQNKDFNGHSHITRVAHDTCW